MANNRPLSWTTRLNWLLDFAVFAGAVLASLTGIYFLYFVSGGYQGGRNPTYGMNFLFDRTTWGNLHTWGGVLMIAAVLLHLTLHLDWISMMSRKILATLKGASRLSRGAKINVIVDLVVATSFGLVALSGIYFLFASTGGYQNGTNPGWDPMFLLDRTTWDLIHTWAGTAMVVAAVIHLAIHWRWVTKVTAKMFSLPLRRPQPQTVQS